MTKREEILEVMQETIAERVEAISARPAGKREFEVSLVSSGMEIVEPKNEREALFWANEWRL